MHESIRRRWRAGPERRRRGIIVVLAAAMFVMVFGFAAFSVDVGYVTLTKTQMQAAADSAALGSAQDLHDGLGLGSYETPTQVEDAVSLSAQELAAEHRCGDQSSAYLERARDVRLGQVTWDPLTNSWRKTWGASPYNLVEVTIRRDQSAGAADGPLPLFFSPVIGHEDANLTTSASAAVVSGGGFRIDAGSLAKAGILPFTLDEYTWDNLVDHGIGEDDFRFDHDLGEVVSGSDGVKEVNLYPDGDGDLPPGNRGTVDLGSSSNSTSDIARQILYGLNEDDLSYFDGQIEATPSNPLWVNGDTGISAGMKDELEAIKGQPRAIPIFREVSGNGNNATYKLVRFVGIRIVEVKMTGNPKRVMIEPAPYTDGTVIADKTGEVSFEDGLFTSPMLLE